MPLCAPAALSSGAALHCTLDSTGALSGNQRHTPTARLKALHCALHSPADQSLSERSALRLQYTALKCTVSRFARTCRRRGTESSLNAEWHRRRTASRCASCAGDAPPKWCAFASARRNSRICAAVRRCCRCRRWSPNGPPAAARRAHSFALRNDRGAKLTLRGDHQQMRLANVRAMRSDRNGLRTHLRRCK